MKQRADQQAKMNKIENQSAESSAKLSSKSAERLSGESAKMANSSQQKDLKPTITSIQTMIVSPQKKLSEHSSPSRISADMSNSSILSQMLSNESQQKFLNQSVSNSKQTHRVILPKTNLENNQIVQNPGSTFQRPRLVTQPISNLRFISNAKVIHPQGPQFTSPNLNRLMNPQILNQRPLTPQICNQRTPQVSNQRSVAPQHMPSPMKQISTVPSKQTTTHVKILPVVSNPEVKTGRVSSSNVPQFSQPKIVIDQEPMGIQIASVCSVSSEIFENWEKETKKEEAEEFLSKRKPEASEPSQYFEKQLSDTKRMKVSNSGSFQPSGTEMKTEVKVQGEEIKYQRGEKDLNIKGTNSEEFVENKEDERKGRYMILKRNLVEEALAKANITQSDMMNAGMTVSSNQPSTSSVNITSNNYITLPQSNMMFYMGSGQTQEVVNITQEKEGGVSILKISLISCN